MTIFYGNSEGTIYGPYLDMELSARARAMKLLSSPEPGVAADVFVIRAETLEQANVRLQGHLRGRS